MNAISSSNESTGLRTFSGDTEDAKEYKRWRTWVTNKILTLGDKVPDHAKGAYVYTLLAGKALECVEHLEQSAYQKAGGEKIIFELLDQRFPQKDHSDEMSEALTEVFQLRAREGESLKAWVSRATELFDRVKRKVNVAFPEEARGWIILHRAGLTEEQKAVILSRSLGVLKREEIGRAMRKGGESGAAFVEDFVAMVESQSSWLSLQLLRERREVHKTVNTAPVSSPTWNIEQLLVNSPGYGVLDSGCGRSIVGVLTLKEFEPLWQARGWTIPVPFAETNHFKFGNGQKETTQLSVRVPVQLGGRPGTIKAAIVQGSAPLLISRNALRTLKAVIDFSASELIIFDERVKVPLLTNQAGQFTVDLLGEQDVALEPFAEELSMAVETLPVHQLRQLESQEEANQLRALFRKAMQHGIEPVEALGGFPHVDDFELVGTMSDAAKRQSDGQYPVHSKANRKLPMPMPSTSEEVEKQDGCYATSATNLPYPSSSEAPLPNSSLPPFPPGVINTEQWGRSIINFGKYKGKNISYIELLSSTSEDMRSYVKWCSSRQSTAGGELKDLTSFMRRYEMENSHSALIRGELIPGTTARRSFK
ncbi:unnamed protein product [Durusdinium trenchii]|uniref:Uncharacterized protein n=1 Tax=Durusdinium trenchii TaxID=1381693 RepID=A0ABP0J4Y2_9DINO